MKGLKIKINNQFKIEKLNNIRKKLKLSEIDYTNGISIKGVNDSIQEVKENIKNYINRVNYIYNKEELI